MKKLLLLWGVVMLLSSPLFAQLGIGTASPDASSMLDVVSTTKGFLAPRMTQSERNLIPNPATGLLIYQTDGLAGFYYNNGTSLSPVWMIPGSTGIDWSLTGNGGTVPATNFLGTTDEQSLIFRIRNLNSGIIDSALGLTSIGYRSLQHNGSGSQNTALGWKSLVSNTDGSQNTAIGSKTLQSNLSGINNTAVGFQALQNNLNGDNTAIGESAMRGNTNGTQNVALGSSTLWTNSTGNGNTALGYQALYTNNASSNTAIGGFSLFLNSTGNQNVSIGYQTMYNNTLGQKNVAAGYMGLYNNRTAGANVAIGFNALYTQSYTNGGIAWNTCNTAIGTEALYTNNPISTFNSGDNNTATGYQALNKNTTGYKNTSTGVQSLYNNTTGYSNVATGFRALYNNTLGIDNTAMGLAALYGNSTAECNVAIGNYALYTQSYSNGSAVWVSGNTAIGFQALINNQPVSTSTGFQNTAIGFNALMMNSTGYSNTAIGNSALLANTTGSRNTAVGLNALVGGNYNNSTAIGFDAQISADNQVKLGDNNITSLICTGAYNATTANNPNLYVDNNGKIFRSTASYINNHTSFTPANSSDPNGNTGDITWDSDYIYVKTAGGWKRAALSTW